MSWILIVAVVIIVIVLAALKSKQGSGGTVDAPYQPAKALFSPAERSFLSALDQAVGSDHRVFGKVRVADLATIKPGLSNAARQGALNRIAAKHVDFVVCRTSDLAVVCAVELNDKSHSSQRAQARDELLAKVCRAINLPLLTIPAKTAYSAQDVRTQFLTVVSPNTAASG
jgi:hypothetical protein